MTLIVKSYSNNYGQEIWSFGHKTFEYSKKQPIGTYVYVTTMPVRFK